MFLGLRTIIYPVADVATAKAWYTAVLGVTPHFDEPFYVGFDVGGYELALRPSADIDGRPETYWGVDDVDAALAQLRLAGARDHTPVLELGRGIRVASVLDPSGNLLGIIENQNFAAAPRPPEARGPGR